MRATRSVTAALLILSSLSCARDGTERSASSAVIFAGGLAPADHPVATANPLSGDTSAVRLGGQLFGAMNCDGCHGGGAVGWVGPSLTDGRWRYGGSDTEIFQSIYFGRPRGMPAFGGVLSPDAVWRIVTYLRSLPPPKDVPTESW